MMVHSAEWTAPMLAALGDTPGKRTRYDLVRRFGYGVPNFERANASALNHLALFAQAEIQPFKIEKGRKYNECHYYTLPIPRQMLEQLENEVVEMKVTLSYFIDPNRRTWTRNATNRTDSASTTNARTNPSSGSNSA